MKAKKQLIPQFTTRRGMDTNIYRPLPYPQTPKSAHKYFQDHGICISYWAVDMEIPRSIVVDLLRGKLKGYRGNAHKAAIAFGLKPLLKE